jgi:hypothetical protein
MPENLLGSSIAAGGLGYTYTAPGISTAWFSQFFNFGNQLEGDIEAGLLLFAGIAFVIALGWYLIGILGHRGSLMKAKTAFIGTGVFLVLIVAWPSIFNAILAIVHGAGL